MLSEEGKVIVSFDDKKELVVIELCRRIETFLHASFYIHYWWSHLLCYNSLRQLIKKNNNNKSTPLNLLFPFQTSISIIYPLDISLLLHFDRSNKVFYFLVTCCERLFFEIFIRFVRDQPYNIFSDDIFVYRQ